MKSLMDTSLVPFDITLEIKYSGKKVQAHKCILGMASPVFSNIFFGESKETKDVILVEEARDGAFSSVINYIYGNGITWAGEDDIKDMFAIVDVAERYEIKALMVEVKEKIENVSVREDNVVQVGAAALEFMYLNVLSNALFYNCVGFLQTRLTKSEDFVSFASKYCDTKYCKAALKLVASFSAAELSNSWSGCESDSISPLKKSGIISLADEKDQNLVTSEDPQVKQELPSPPQTLEISITVCKEEQKQDCVPEGESKEYFEVDKQEQDDWYSGSCTISCEVGLSAPSESVPPVESAPPSNVDPQTRQEQEEKCSDSDIGSSCPTSSEVDMSALSESASGPLGESAPSSSSVVPQARHVLFVTDQPTPCPELVRGRKPGLIFSEVWQIPVMEIGSEGSFANHCGKALLLDVLDSIPDMSTLVDISDQLRNREEFESLQESDRQEIVAEASKFLNTALRAIREKMNTEEERENPVVTLDVYKLHQKLAKMWPGKEKEVFIFLQDMYTVIKDKAVGKDERFQKKSDVLSFWSARLAVQANSVLNTVTRTSWQDDVAASRASNELVVEEGDKEANMGNWQQWGDILADQERIGQFKSLLAMSSALPNMTPVDMAAFCGLGQSDSLAVYTTNISSLSPSTLSSMGITSSQLSSLAQIASLTVANSQIISAQAKRQAEFERKHAMLQRKHAMLQRKHCYVCEVEFDSRYKFRDHCKKIHDVTMRDFEKDNTENIPRIKRLRYRKKMLEDAKDINDNKKSNDILMKKVKKRAYNNAYAAKVRNTRASSQSGPFYPQKNDESKQNALVKTPTRKMVVFYCPHCQEGFHTKEKKEAHAHKMTCYFNSEISSFKPGSLKMSLL